MTFYNQAHLDATPKGPEPRGTPAGSKPLLLSALESYTQQMKYQEEGPSQYSEDGADKNRNDIDRDVVREEQVRQEEKDHPKNRVDDKYRHVFSLPFLLRADYLKRSSSVLY